MNATRERWVDVLAEASTRFHNGMRAAGLEVKPGDRLRESEAVSLAVELPAVDGVEPEALAVAIGSLVDLCQAKRLQRFYLLEPLPPETIEYSSVLGPLRCYVSFSVVRRQMRATFDVRGTEA